MNHSIAQRAARRRRGAFDRPLDTDKLALQEIARRPDGGITMSTKINERQVWRELRVGKLACGRKITRFDISEIRSHSMT